MRIFSVFFFFFANFFFEYLDDFGRPLVTPLQALQFGHSGRPVTRYCRLGINRNSTVQSYRMGSDFQCTTLMRDSEPRRR